MLPSPGTIVLSPSGIPVGFIRFPTQPELHGLAPCAVFPPLVFYALGTFQGGKRGRVVACKGSVVTEGRQTNRLRPLRARWSDRNAGFRKGEVKSPWKQFYAGKLHNLTRVLLIFFLNDVTSVKD